MRTSASIRSTSWTWPLAALLVVALATTAAHADPSRDAARAHVDQANTHYKLGRFSEALAEYSSAYELFPAPALLFNLGQCHRELGSCTRAIFFFQGYLRERPDARDRRLVEELIAECRQVTERQAAGRRALEQRLAAERRASALIAASMPATAPLLSHALGSRPTDRRGPSIFRRWWFWSAVAVAVFTATGATLGYYYSGTTTRTLPAGSLGTVDGRGSR